MTDIFFIAYQFPPLNVGGSFRPLKFVKYFNDFGINPIIFTLDPKDYYEVYDQKSPDYSLLDEVKETKKEIIFVRSEKLLSSRKNKFKKFFQIYFNLTRGFEHRKWAKYFFEATDQALKKYSPKVILVTAPPFGIIDLALKLSRKTGIPLVIDMRDSLSMWISQPYGSYFHYIFTLKKERKWFKHAEKIIAVTKQMINDWKNVHKKINEEKFTVIPNGYDGVLSYDNLTFIGDKKTITIGYIGSFYYNPESRNLTFTPWHKKSYHRKLQYLPRKEDWLYRSPYFFFKTLRYLFDKNPDLSKKITVKFAGLYPDWLLQMVKEFKLDDNIKLTGFIQSSKIEHFQNSCDFLLATSVKVYGGEDYCIAGKTFDYISAKKPILGFVAPGAQKEFLLKSGTGIICNPDNVEESAYTLNSVFEKGITLHPNQEFLEKHHRKQQTKLLSELIHSL